jgi:hypothetical protein
VEASVTLLNGRCRSSKGGPACQAAAICMAVWQVTCGVWSSLAVSAHVHVCYAAGNDIGLLLADWVWQNFRRRHPEVSTTYCLGTWATA